RYADLRNSTLESKAHAVTAAAFLSGFAAGRPWAHLDIAGVASDTGRPWARHGGTGWGVRTLVELVAGMAPRSDDPGGPAGSVG
ncbi:MAG TPA: hypothetical protein VGI54_11765, partial [Solirubrobacteraceae bacterium]